MEKQVHNDIKEARVSSFVCKFFIVVNMIMKHYLSLLLVVLLWGCMGNHSASTSFPVGMSSDYPPPMSPPPSETSYEYENTSTEVLVGGGTIGPVRSSTIVPVEKSGHVSITRKVDHEKPRFTFDSLVNQLSPASFVYSVPQKVNVKDSFDVRMLINPNLTQADLIKELSDSGQVFQGTVNVSKVVVAKLVSSDFTITPITPERQPVDVIDSTEWRWNLKPIKAGPKQKFRITISAVVTVDGEKNERFIDTYDGIVEVDITSKQRVTEWLSVNWQWAWGVVIPFLLWLFMQYRKRS